MTDPSIDRATGAIGNLAASVNTMTNEVIALEALRASKIKWIQTLLYVLIPGVILLIVLAISNFALLNRVRASAVDAKNSAAAAQSTNDLLLGCFRAGTQCAEAQKKATALRSTEARQATYVMLICLRLNPQDEDPNAVSVQRCVQQYYPGFTLPTKVAPTPKR